MTNYKYKRHQKLSGQGKIMITVIIIIIIIIIIISWSKVLPEKLKFPS